MRGECLIESIYINQNLVQALKLIASKTGTTDIKTVTAHCN